jgi:pilus assembly protein CpaE
MTEGQEVIKVLIVDDIPDTRENLRKLLAFETDIEVVGGDGAGTGREAVELAKQYKPDVVLMDINMPDMDGIQATKAISTSVRTAAVVIMSVQSEPGYLRQAMLAGARDFLTKPIASEELYATIRRVYERNAPIREQEAALSDAQVAAALAAESKPRGPARTTGAGHIIVVYSPQAGAGVTTLATNIASALMRPDTRVLLVDCNLQFGDVDAFLNLQAQSNISDLTKAVDDLDEELVENVLVTHASGLRVLTAPLHPEQAYDVYPTAVRELLRILAGTFDFVIVDTPTQYDEMTLRLFDVAERILLVANPTIPSVRNTRKMLDIFDGLQDPPNITQKIMFVLNRVTNEKERGRGTVPTASIENHLKREVIAQIPADDRSVLTSVNQGVPLVAKQKSRSPGREMVALAEYIRTVVETQRDDLLLDDDDDPDTHSKSGLRSIFG